jgi:hypothetical protein
MAQQSRIGSSKQYGGLRSCGKVIMGKSFIFAVSVLLTSAMPAVFAQTAAVPFTLIAQQGQSVTPVADGQNLGITSSGIGQAVSFTLTGTYNGATTAILSSQAQLVGSADFTAGPIAPVVPATLNPGKSFSLTITYTPTTAGTESAELTIPFTESAASSTGTPAQGSLVFGLSGTTSSLTVNYFSAPSNNVIPLSNGGTIPFPSTLVNTSVSVTILIANAGTAAGQVTSVSLAGSNAFQLQGIGLLPAGIASGGTLEFNLLYYPSLVGSDTGTLTIQFPTGPFMVNLTGTSVSPSLAYEMINGTKTTPLPVGQPITLPSTNIGSTTSVTIQVQNNGTASTNINNISTTGTGFSLSSLLVLPAGVAPNNSISFTLNFTPPAPGVDTGTLTIGGTIFALTGTGLGPQLTYSYTSGSGSSTTVIGNGTILFSSVPLAQTTTTSITVTNTGTTAATVSSIGIVTGGQSSAFALSNLPALPAALAPNASLTFTATFTPSVSGLSSATLLINTTDFTLSGFGASAPALPSYQITGQGGQVQPSTQPSVGLTLSQSYPLAVNGTLTLGVSSSTFASDPSVQFATGGQTVAFSIPANTTNAIFANGSSTIQLQTGTVAETITISPTFTISGGVSLTPASGTPLVLAVPQLAPTLLSAQISSVSATTITVLIEGYSTSRSLSKLNIQLKSLSSAFNLPSTVFTIDVSQSASLWYGSGASGPYGGEFAISVPFTTTLASTSTLPLATNIAVTATISNSIGTSGSVSSQ